MSTTGYIVIVSPSYGGAEKRFFDIFTGLMRSGRPIRFIAPSGLIERLQQDHPEREDIFGAMIPVPMAAWSRIGFIRAFRTLLNTIPRGSHFHYPLNCLWPLHLLRGDAVSMSVVDCTTVPTLLSTKQADVWHRLSFSFVRHIDVLSPAIFQATRRPYLGNRISLTPGGTYLVPPPLPVVDKQAQVVFLGRLVPGKGVDELLDLLPELWRRLEGRLNGACRFSIAGYGTLEKQVGERARELQGRGIPVEFIGYQEATPLLAASAVVLSLQAVTNFPSRVVPEALLAGCAVVVRDTGDSREFGTSLPGLEYCSATLDADELAGMLARYLPRITQDLQYRDVVRSAALQRFSSSDYIDYFSRIIFGADTQTFAPRVQ